MDKDTLSRERIVNDINKNFLVEASAGSGKTTSLVNRMIAMVKSGIKVEDIVTITFTKKAANEFYERFYKELTKSDDPLCKEALENIDLCFMGTIDSFCNSVLSEHPFEANVPSSSEVIEDDADLIPELNATLDDIRLNGEESNKELLKLFETFHNKDNRYKLIIHSLEQREYKLVYDNPNSEEFKNYTSRFGILFNKYREVLEFLSHLPSDKISTGKTNNKLYVYLQNNITRINNIELDDLREINRLKRRKAHAIGIKKDFGFNNIPSSICDWFDEPKEKARTIKVSGQKISELFDDVFAYFIYIKSLEFLDLNRNTFADNLRRAGKLKFIDNLIYLNNVLKNPKLADRAIKNINQKHKYYLIDEFQDTSPLQSELFFRLTSDKYYPNWEDANVEPGRLFMVGDPKQSIYRFRGADFSSYSKVKNILVNRKIGEVLYLTKNFRSNKAMCEYFNELFNKKEYLKDIPNLQTKCDEIPIEGKANEGFIIGPYLYSHGEMGDPEFVANTIKYLIDKFNYRASDFMIITFNKGKIDKYKEALEKVNIMSFAEGVTSFDSLYIKNVVALFKYIIHPSSLYEFNVITKELFENNYTNKDLTKNLETVVGQLPSKEDFVSPASLFEEIIHLPFILKHAGNEKFTNLIALLNILKSKEESGEINSFDEAIAVLDEKTNAFSIERTSLLKNEANVVRIANLHKVKGLEANIVFLTDTPSKEKSVTQHIDAEKKEEVIFKILGGEFNNTPIIQNTSASLDSLRNLEQNYLEEERKRLMYVAATRASKALFISKDEKSPWKDLIIKDLPIYKYEEPDEDLPEEIDFEETINNTDAINEISHRPTYLNKLPSESKNVPNFVKDEDVYIKDNNALILGTIVHRLMELIVKGKTKKLDESICDKIAEEYNATEHINLLKEVYKTIYSGGYPQVSGAPQDIYKFVQNYECYTEVPFTYKKDNILTYGVIDLLLVKDNQAIIIDYKTDKNINTDHSEQLKAYQESLKISSGLDCTAFIYNIKIK